MDPEIALTAMRLAILDRDADEAYDYASALVGWIDRAGYLPLDMTPFEENYARTIAKRGPTWGEDA